MNMLYNWFCANELYFNASKTNYMFFSPPNVHFDTSKYDIFIGNRAIDRIGDGMTERSLKFLGLHIDEHLVWDAHIKHINSKLSRSISRSI